MRFALLAIAASLFAGVSTAKSPTAEQALALTPIQPGIDFTTPAKADIAACTIAPEKSGGITAWVVRDGQGRNLRRFADTNGDNVVDVWSYYRDGVEVYRDIDSDFDNKADQYRWLGTAGTRWGIDENEDGRVDSWRAISAYEVAEEVVAALRSRDSAAFARVLLSPAELKGLGLGGSVAGEVAAATGSAAKGFQETAAGGKLTAGTRFIDFGSVRPGVIPGGVDGATADATFCEGATALVEIGGETEQVQLGPLVQVGDGWRVITGPKLGSNSQDPLALFMMPGIAPTAGGERPSEKMQQLMTELEKLDRQSAGSPGAAAGKRIDLLRQLADASSSGLKEQWIQQLADTLAADVLENSNKASLQSLDALIRKTEAEGVADSLVAHVRFQRIWAEYGLLSQDPKEDYPKVQRAWLDQLEQFVKKHPDDQESAEALLQLGMAAEFAGETEQAQDWYARLAKQFPDTTRGRKASGAIRRLSSVGKPIELRAQKIDGGAFDLKQLAGKHVLIHYWATWCEPCKSDMAQLKELYAKNGRTLTIVGVNLDASVADAKAYLATNRLPWTQVYDEGGLDGRLANEMGVMTLPLMIMLDEKGQVVNRNLHVAELETEIRRLIR
ncbi:Thiol-disulfide oxidoreductase ResA [Pirellulimonas nuda]|uniref:Thiol-disulfide oxidoreductase ResA n=1 Tax=Pirellulimonas nuda TaxID=2528009 RepID=A0A518D930_9BACT|nr:thioredoxin-like domain-containing protein [Pirellulimonas nuda]QDU87982.1 Thiol-disulfide oxidoreductase ResA [Pirellulimonas nuda]